MAALRADEEYQAKEAYRAERAGDWAAVLIHRKARWDAMTARHRLATPALGDLSARLALFGDAYAEYEAAAHAARAAGQPELADTFEQLADDLLAASHVLREREADRFVKGPRYAAELYPTQLGQLLDESVTGRLTAAVAQLRRGLAQLCARLGVTP